MEKIVVKIRHNLIFIVCKILPLILGYKRVVFFHNGPLPYEVISLKGLFSPSLNLSINKYQKHIFIKKNLRSTFNIRDTATFISFVKESGEENEGNGSARNSVTPSAPPAELVQVHNCGY